MHCLLVLIAFLDQKAESEKKLRLERLNVGEKILFVDDDVLGDEVRRRALLCLWHENAALTE